MRYAYICERCDEMFEMEFAEIDEPAPREAVCPKCEYPHAVKAFVVPDSSAGCTPGSGC
ncbi:MAG: hypothetical protein Q7W16_09030 [Coriobacteriia bacterium]|nr:hypothetical protein [Coriobacteriia bacterium]